MSFLSRLPDKVAVAILILALVGVIVLVGVIAFWYMPDRCSRVSLRGPEAGSSEEALAGFLADMTERTGLDTFPETWTVSEEASPRERFYRSSRGRVPALTVTDVRVEQDDRGFWRVTGGCL